MYDVYFSWQRLLLWMVVLTVLSLVSLLSLWATNRRVSWTSRLAPLALFLASLFPIGCFELVPIFACQAILVMGAFASVRGWSAWRRTRRLRKGQGAGEEAGASSTPSPRRRYFTLAKLFRVLALVGVCAAAVSYAPDEWDYVNWTEWTLWFESLVVGAALAMITIAAWIAISRTRWILIVPVLVLTWVLIGRFSNFFWFIEGYTLAVRDWGLLVMFAASAMLLLAVQLWLLEKAAWGWWRSDESAAASSQNKRWIPRLAIGAVAATSLLPATSLYWALVPPSAPPSIVPSPNGYDRLLEASKKLNWQAISGDPDTAPLSQCAAFAQDNAAVMKEAAEALEMETRVPLDEGLWQIRDFSGFRDLARAGAVIGRSQAAAGEYDKAKESLLDVIKVGNQITSGAFVVDELVADAIEHVGVDGMVPLLDDLDDDSLDNLTAKLKSCLESRDPLADMLARDRFFSQLYGGWHGRLDVWLNDWTHGELFDATVDMPPVRNDRDARLKLLIVECALARYRLAHGEWPSSLDDLVPRYLDAVPIDPFSGRPLMYRRTDAGYLLYSVGRNGVDDGGIRPAPNQDRLMGDLLLPIVP